MEKWDVLTMILEENKLKNLLEIIHMNTKWEVDMMKTIIDATTIWTSQNKEQNDIVDALQEQCQLALNTKENNLLKRELNALKHQ